MRASSSSTGIARLLLAGTLSGTLIAGWAAPASAKTSSAGATPHPGDSTAVVAAMAAFHSALEKGDSTRALSFLAGDAIILESGHVESRAEYRSHHLASDMKFAQAVKEARTVLRVTVKGDAAWVSSSSKSKGEFSGRPVDSVGAELMVLVRTRTGWKISAIHWSSRRQQPPAT